MPVRVDQVELVTTGIAGLDHILQGGLPKGRAFLIEGTPGVGKTTLGLQFLLAGARAGERSMLVSLIETREELLRVAQSHGWRLDGIHILEIPQDLKDSAAAVQTVFPSEEVEFGEISTTLYDAVEQYRPDRLLIDSVSQLAMLTDNWQQMRRTVLRIRDLSIARGTTTLLTASWVAGQLADMDTIVHGTISLKADRLTYGSCDRYLSIKKMRGHQFFPGIHNFRIATGGLKVFPWPHRSGTSRESLWQLLSSGNATLDQLLGGGLEPGTACLIYGTTGVGKSTLASLYLQAAAERGEHGLLLCFDERRDTFVRRCRSLDMKVPDLMAAGQIEMRQVDAGSLAPGEFAHQMLQSVRQKKTRVIIIDSLTGYINSVGDENHVLRLFHDLLGCLSEMGVLTIMIMAKRSDSSLVNTEIDASYISDTVVVLRHFESGGRIRRCIAVVKKRHGSHEHTIREFKIDKGGCEVGPPLTEFHGVLSGAPVYHGDPEKLLPYDNED